MALVICPDCAGSVPDLAQFCIHCGRAIAADAASRPTTRSGAPHRTPALAIACPSCGAADVRRLSVIYAGGLSTFNATGVSVLDGEVGVLSSSGSTQTALSQAAAPPEIPMPISAVWAMALLVLAVFGLMTGSLTGFVFIGLPGIASALWAKRYYARQRPEHELFRRRWANTWMCLRCGARFEAETPQISESR